MPVDLTVVRVRAFVLAAGTLREGQMRHSTLSRRWFVHRVRTRHSGFVYERPSQCLQRARLLGAVA